MVEKKDIHKMGTLSDLARRTQEPRQDNEAMHSWIARVREWIFKLGMSPDSAFIKKTPIGHASANPTRVSPPTACPDRMLILVPKQCAFSIRFAEFGQSAYELFVPDLLHEFELGVWKSTFTHLVRILIAAGRNAVQILDDRPV